MSVYPPPLNQSPIFNPSAFTETVTSVIGGSGTTPTVDYLEFPDAQGPETFTNNGGNNTLVVGASELSIGYDVLTVPKGIALNGQGFAFNNGTVVSTTTWSGLQTKIEAIQAIAPASDSTTLNVNDAITIQNGESPVSTNTIILSTSAGDNQLLLNDDAGEVGYVLTSGGPDGSMTWAVGGGGGSQNLASVLAVAPAGVGDAGQSIFLQETETADSGYKLSLDSVDGVVSSFYNTTTNVLQNQTSLYRLGVFSQTGDPETVGSLFSGRPNTISLLNKNSTTGLEKSIAIDVQTSPNTPYLNLSNVQTGIAKSVTLNSDQLQITNILASTSSTLSTTNLSIISGNLNASFTEVSLDSGTNTILTKQQGVGIVRQTEINTTAVQVYESLALEQDNYVSVEPKQIGIGVDGAVDYGTAGQVLTSGGAGGVLSWTTPSGTPSLDAVLNVAPAGEATADLSITFKETDSPFLTTRFDIDGINSTRPSLELQNDTLINIGTDNNGPNTITIGHVSALTADYSPVNINGKFSINGVLFSGADGGSSQIGVASYTIPQDALRNSLYTLIIAGTATPTPLNFPTDDTGGKYITIFNGGNQSVRCQCSAVPTRPFVGGNNGLAGATTYAIRPNQTVQFLSAGAQGFLLFAQSNPNSNVGTYPFPIQSLTTNQRVIATRITGAAVNGTFTYTSIAGQQNFASPASVQLTAEDATGNHIMTLRTNTVAGFTYVSSSGSFPTTLHIYALGV